MTEEVVAFVVTYRRPRLATQVVRWLLDEEGMSPDDVYLIVNGDGGLDDPALERSINVVELRENLGPAGGFAAGFRAVLAAHPHARWFYACEDDIGLFGLPSPRVADVLKRAAALDDGRPIGAIVAYGGQDVDRTGQTTWHPIDDDDLDLHEVTSAPWGATLVAREVLEAGVLPDADLFWGYEDFDWFLRVGESGFRVVLDMDSARRVHQRTAHPGQTVWKGVRPGRGAEAWTRYYETRNFFVMSRRHGDWRWTARHLLKTVRRTQGFYRKRTAYGRSHRRAMVNGLLDGIRGRTGKDPRFLRVTGEL